MKKLFLTDFKRLLQSKTSIIITILAPLILVVLISLTIAPLYFSDVRLDYFHITILNEDTDPSTKLIADSLIKSDTLKGLIDVRFVDTKQEGLDSLEEGSVAFIHIPPGLQDSLYYGDQVIINYYGNKDRPLENALLLEALVPGIDLVNYSQNAVNELYFSIKPLDKQLASDVFFETSAYLLIKGMAIDYIYAPTQEFSPLSDILPVEFYAACLLLLFVALGALPIARITEDDKKGGLLQRQLIGGISAMKSFISKWAAGTLLLFIQYTVLCFALLVITGRLSYFAGNVPMLLGCSLLFCILVSLIMIVIAINSKSAVYVSLTAVLSLAALGGLIIPSAYMPEAMRAISGYTPFAPALRMSLAGMFNADIKNVGLYFAVMLVYITVLAPIGIRSYVRRER
jgi:ABC-type multidrug transport system permease subunit